MSDQLRVFTSGTLNIQPTHAAIPKPFFPFLSLESCFGVVFWDFLGVFFVCVCVFYCFRFFEVILLLLNLSRLYSTCGLQPCLKGLERNDTNEH